LKRSERSGRACYMRDPVHQLHKPLIEVTHTVSTTASSNRRVEGTLLQFTPVKREEEGPGVLYRSTLTGRGDSVGDRMVGISSVCNI